MRQVGQVVELSSSLSAWIGMSGDVVLGSEDCVVILSWSVLSSLKKHAKRGCGAIVFGEGEGMLIVTHGELLKLIAFMEEKK